MMDSLTSVGERIQHGSRRLPVRFLLRGAVGSRRETSVIKRDWARSGHVDANIPSSANAMLGL